MRITRSTLRRLIAEESARLLRETAEEEGQMDEGTGADGNPKMLHVMYRGFRPVFIVTDVDANPLDEEDAVDVTQQIQPAKSNMTTPELAQSIIDFITDESNGIMYVFDEEMNDSETDEKFVTEDYVEHLESLIASGEEEAATRGGEMHKRAVERGEDEDLYEGAFPEEIEGIYGEEPPEFDEEEDDSWLDYETGDDDVPYSAADVALRKGKGHRTDESAGKRHTSPRDRLAAYLKKQGADVDAVMSAIDAVIDQHHNPDWGDDPSTPTSEDVTFSLDDSVLDAIPEDDDDKWHSMLDAVLADEFDADAVADDAAYRRDIEDTERDLSHPSRFLEEDDLNESIDMMSAGIGAVVGIVSLYAVGGLASLAKQVLNALSDRQQDAALEAAHRKESSKMAATVEALSEDEHLISLFKQLKSIQRSKRDGVARDFTEKTQEINDYIRSKSKDLDLDDMDASHLRGAVSKRIKKNAGKKGDDEKLDEARWAKLAGILKG